MVQERIYERIADNVFLLYEKMFNLYVVKGKKTFLIDSGVTTRAEAFNTSFLNVMSQFYNGEKPNIDTLLLTHTHWDHTGAASWLQERYHFNVITSKRGHELLEKDSVVAFINRLNQDYKKMVNDTTDKSFTKLTHMSSISEGDRIHVDDTQYFEVYDTPGHTKCSVSYFLLPQRVLFPGDATGVLEQTQIIKPLFLSSYTQYVNSVKKLLALPAEFLALPHNRFIKGEDKVKNHIQSCLERTQAIKAAILERLQTEDNISVIAEAIYKEEFPKPTLIGPREALMINIEAMIKSIINEFPEELPQK